MSNNQKRILITGASGLIGKTLTQALLGKGYDVRHLSRNKKNEGIPTYIWDVQSGMIDQEALKGSDVIIHLAGENVASQRWTAQRKKEILESRTRSTRLLFNALKSTNHAVSTFVSASAVGYYGFQGDHVFFESHPPGNDFLAKVVKAWEDEAVHIESLGVRTVRLRIGVVLSNKGGALVPIVKSVKAMVGAPLGTGSQWMSWIHIDDLCEMFIKAIEDPNMAGAYNAVAPNPVTNRTLTQAVGEVLGKPLLLPNVPAFVLKAMFGEMSEIVLNGSRVSSAKVEQAGFTFKFPDIHEALRDLLG